MVPYREGAADGFVLRDWLPGQTELFAEQVCRCCVNAPALRHEYAGTTLWSHSA